MRKICVLLIFCLFILSVFTSCDEPKQPQTITITLDSGVLEENVSTISTAENEEVTLPSGETIWKTDRYSFSGWATTKDGEVSYKAETSFSSSSDETLYAIWTENPKITYLANGGTGDAIIEYHKSGDKVKIKNSSFTKEGWDFVSWNASSDGTGETYLSGKEIAITENLTLYAIWEEGHVIRYYNEETLFASDKISGKSIIVRDDKDLTKDGYEFYGWNTSVDGSGDSYKPGEKYSVDVNLSLYAMWQIKYTNLSFTLNTGSDTYSVSAANNSVCGEITIPSAYKGKAVTAIAENGFKGCSITKVTMPESVTAIGDNAFSFSALIDLVVPDSVDSIGKGAFSGCTSLKSIYIDKAKDNSLDTSNSKWGAPLTDCTVTWKKIDDVGDTITLGKSGDTDIVWKALSVDPDNKRALLISEKVLETRAFDTDSNAYSGSDIQTYLRSGGFFTTYGLSKDYMLAVDITTNIEATAISDVGSDYVFLLSKTEAENTSYFADNDARIAYFEGSGSGWWLRSPLGSDDYVYCVNPSGAVLGGVLYYVPIGLRPAFWYTWK